MLNLKVIINQLPSSSLKQLEEQFIQSKADNYLVLLRAYRANDLSDAAIIEALHSNTTSFHTLKSRLYTKIQQHLLENVSDSKSDIIHQLAKMNTYCYETSRETTDAILTKLVNDLKAYDMPGDALIVYSALKKIYQHTPKYFEYSQLFNKHLDKMLELEKAEELLGSFMQSLAQYDLSKLPEIIEILTLIQNEIQNIYQLNPSNNILIIKNIIAVHLHLFTPSPHNNVESTDDLLAQIERIVLNYPNNSTFQIYSSVANFLRHEYYMRIDEHKKAQLYFEKVNAEIKYWLLRNNLCLSYQFLYSKSIVS